MFLNGHKLINYANARVGRPFEWGKNDCNTCVLECLYILFPEWKDVLEEVKGSYKTKIEALRFYSSRSNSWEDELLVRGFVEVLDTSYRPGDVILLPFEKKLISSYICSGTYSISVSIEEGTHLTKTTELLRLPNVKKFRKGV